MEFGMLTLLGKTVTLMESMGFLWLLYTGFELGFWEELQEDKSLEELLKLHQGWNTQLVEHWLEQARIQGLIVCNNGKYRLNRVGKAINLYRNFGLEAMYKEFVLYWGPTFSQLPQLITGEAVRPDMGSEMENELISRASRASEVFVWPLLKAKCEKENWLRILDVGCGEGFFLNKFMQEFPKTEGVGIDINPAVVERAQAQANLYSERLKIELGDILDCPDPLKKYDCCLLNNNIYYFSTEQRVGILERIKKWLVPGGRLGILTALRGEASSVPFIQTHIPQNLMSFFLACHDGFEGLPYEANMTKLLEDAGFIDIDVVALPFKVSHYFFARNPLE
jgi:SAM-dependent methyltransferase